MIRSSGPRKMAIMIKNLSHSLQSSTVSPKFSYTTVALARCLALQLFSIPILRPCNLFTFGPVLHSITSSFFVTVQCYLWSRCLVHARFQPKEIGCREVELVIFHIVTSVIMLRSQCPQGLDVVMLTSLSGENVNRNITYKKSRTEPRCILV